MSLGCVYLQKWTPGLEPFYHKVYIKNPIQRGVPCLALGLYLTRKQNS